MVSAVLLACVCRGGSASGSGFVRQPSAPMASQAVPSTPMASHAAPNAPTASQAEPSQPTEVQAAPNTPSAVAFDKDSFVAKVDAIVLSPTTDVTVSWAVKARTVTRVLDQVAKKTLVGRIDEVTRDLDASAAIDAPPHIMPTVVLDTRDKRGGNGATLQ
jgi:hypothetical protein